jgi:hypothetical protein
MKSFTQALLLALAILAAACRSGGSDEPQATATPRPLPSPVAFAQEPALEYMRGDPAFEALPDATAHFGSLGGAIYQVEIPNNWNGRLLLYMHGSRNFEPELSIDMPAIRSYLIRNGIAWGASSYSSNVPSLGPLPIDETAALWDFFVREFGRPAYTYVTGHSLGGIASVLAAERYGDRYDGSLPLCGTWYTDSPLDFLVAGAYVAGVTQAEFDASPSADIYASIRETLRDDASYELLRKLVVDLTGGPRTLAIEGVDVDINVFDAWANSQLAVDVRIFGNRDIVYELSEGTAVSPDEFNEAAVRMGEGPLAGQFKLDPTGDLQIPTLALSTTGETRVGLEDARRLQSEADAAGKGDLLVQRFVRDSFHCGMTNSEWIAALDDLIAWVEEGDKPQGEDVLERDGEDLGEFTIWPRYGLEGADEVPGADGRVIVSGSATLDGQPIDSGVISATVRTPEGLGRRCALNLGFVRSGRFEVPLAAEAEMRGCGGPGASVLLVYDPFGESLFAREMTSWPSSGNALTVHPTFSTAGAQGPARPATFVTGEALDGDEHLPPGTVIEAFIGGTRCGVTSVPYIVTVAGDPTGYELSVTNEELVPACRHGETVTFRVDGEPIDTAVEHDLEFHNLDLVLPDS